MNLTAEYKWRRLRRWVNDRYRDDAASVDRGDGFRSEYHANRRDVFKAVLIVMDAENRRAATESRKR